MGERIAYWKVSVDGWYAPFREVGEKPKPNVREQRCVLFGPCTADDAETQALEWAERTAFIGRQWVGFEFRRSVLVKLPLELAP